MSRRTFWFGLALLALLAGPARGVITGDAETDKALPKLVCNCGGCPKLSIDVCMCGTAERLAGEALDLSQEGKSSDEIVAAFVDRYGEQILAAPPAQGFNLVLWLGPGVILVLGAVFVVWFLRRRAAAGEAAEGGIVPAPVEGRLRGFDPFA